MSIKPIKANVTADEIVAPGSIIELTFSAQVDPQSAQGAIRVVRGCEPLSTSIKLSDRGRVVTVRLGDGAIGGCALVISELLGPKGEILLDRYHLPFSVVPISGKVPDDLRVEHAVRVFIDDVAGRTAGARRGETSRSYRCAESRPPIQGNAGRVGLRRARGASGHRQAARGSWPSGAPTNTDESTRRSFTASSRPKRVSVWPSWYGRDSHWPPRPTRSPPIAVLVEPPDGRKRLVAKLRKAAADVRTVLQRSKIGIARERQVDEAVPSVRAVATVGQIRRLAQNKSIGAIHLDDTQRDQRPGRFDCGRPIGPRSYGWLRRHRYPGRGLRGWSKRHDQPELRESVHHNAFGQQPRQTDIGDHQEHRSRTSPMVMRRTAIFTLQTLRTTTRCVGRCATSTARCEPELPPR